MSSSRLAVAAAALFVIALLLANVGVPEYSHRVHPVALRGTDGLPWAFAFNLLAFVLPGALLALAGQRLRGGFGDAGWLARIGLVLVQLSALAFAAQGLAPLDLSRPLDVGPSRIHVAIWNAWWLAAAAGALLVARGAWRLPRWRSLLPVGVVVALAMVLALQTDLLPLGSGWRQRLALAAWFGWIAWGSWLALPRAAQP